MESGWKMALATIGGAIIMTTGAIYAAHVGLVKPSDNQVYQSTQFKDILEASNRQILEIEALRSELANQDDERKRMIQESEMQKSRLAVLEKKQLAIAFERSDTDLAQEKKQSFSQPKADPVAVHSPISTRQQLILAQGTPVVLWRSTTVTLDYAKDSAKIIINGKNYRRLRVGSRIDLKSPAEQDCVLEVMELNSTSTSGENIIADLVCKRRK
jgi:hypothetical protein